MESGLDPPMRDDGERSDMVDGQTGQDGAATVLGKERAVQTGSSIAAYSLPPGSPDRQAQGDSGKTMLNKEPSANPAPALEASTFDSTGITSAPAQTDGATHVNQPVTSQNPDRQEDMQQMHHVDVRVLGKQLGRIQRDLEEAVRNLLACIWDLKNQTCPLELKPSDDLSALYARCLGPDWENVARDYNSWNAFKAPQATMPLVSSFLYDNILAQQAYNSEVIQDVIKLLRMREVTGRAAQAVCDLSKKRQVFRKRPFPVRPNTVLEKYVFEVACNIAVKESRAALAQDTATFEFLLQAEAEGHMKAL